MRKRSSAVNSPVNGTLHNIGRSVATEINNHPELPGVQKYGAFPRRPRKSQCRTAGKSRPSFTRAARKERERRVWGDEVRKIAEKDSGTRFGRVLERGRDRERKMRGGGREREIPYTSKVVHVCCILDVWISQKHPQFVKGDPSVLLQAANLS